MSALIPASPSCRQVAPPAAETPSTPRYTVSSQSSDSTIDASGPESSYDSGRATPPRDTHRTKGRNTISVAILSAFVTIVIAGRSEEVARSDRAASRRAVALVVVPPLKPTTDPAAARSAAPAATRSLGESPEADL